MPEYTVELKEGHTLERRNGNAPITFEIVKGPAEIVIRTPETPKKRYVEVGKLVEYLNSKGFTKGKDPHLWRALTDHFPSEFSAPVFTAEEVEEIAKRCKRGGMDTMAWVTLSDLRRQLQSALAAKEAE